MIQETEETLYLKFYFQQYHIDSIAIIGGAPKKNYDSLKQVLGLDEIYHVPYEQKEIKKSSKKIYEFIKLAKLVITVIPRHYEVDYYLKEALKEHRKPLVHTRRGDGNAHILISLYEKRANLERILKQGYGEI